MKTPQDLEKDSLKDLETRISHCVDTAVAQGKLTSFGGTIDVSYVSAPIPTILEYIRKYGWEGTSRPRYRPRWSKFGGCVSLDTVDYINLIPKKK